MDEARAREWHQLRLSVAPCTEPCGPFARAVERVTPLAGRDRFAVDQTGDDRLDAVARHGHHRLVEHRQALRQPALPDQGAARVGASEGTEIAVVMTICNLDRLRRRRARASMVAGE